LKASYQLIIVTLFKPDYYEKFGINTNSNILAFRNMVGSKANSTKVTPAELMKFNKLRQMYYMSMPPFYILAIY